ncbi:MAG: signal peptidase II, partial [Myxococcota bacterium]
MERATTLKFVQFFVIVFVGIFADQATKIYAEERLASQRPGFFSHNIELVVPEAFDGETAEEYLTAEFTWSSAEEIDRMLRSNVRDREGRPIRADALVSKDQEITVRRREVVLVEDYFDFQYTRNPGAAFGFLADSESQLRRPFFFVISFMALGFILYSLSGVTLKQQLIIFGLSLIAGGAIGNFIDRIQYGYVIDFILWKYTDQYRWPTFNVADALI